MKVLDFNAIQFRLKKKIKMKKRMMMNTGMH